jgi:hypothetical protein
MTCLFCEMSFWPNKHSPRQKYCSGACRTRARALYKRRYDRAWRKSHPSYMSQYGRRYRKLYGPPGRAAEGFLVS